MTPTVGNMPWPKSLVVETTPDVHVATKEELLLLLQTINKDPALKDRILQSLDQKDPVGYATKELLTEDLTASTLIIQDDNKGEMWLKERLEDNWVLIEQEPSTWHYYHIVTKPAQAIWWSAKTVYKVWTVASTILAPISIVATVIQSPWTPILLLLIKKSAL